MAGSVLRGPRHQRRWWAALRLALTAAVVVASVCTASGQPRSMEQDPGIDNLRHSPGTETAAPGTLGQILVAGEGRRAMLLIAGLGFGPEVTWADFMERHRADYRMLAVGLPGFGGSKPLQMPPPGTPYAEQSWMRSALGAIVTLLNQRKIERVSVIAHWALASQLALQLALDHPDRVESVVLVSGVLKSHFSSVKGMHEWSSAQRHQYAEGMAARWFKTVTRRTWDDNNFMSYDYAVNPRRGLFLWREAQAPSLAVWIRYLLEFYSLDLTSRLRDLAVPVLVVQPGFDDPGMYVEAGGDYMRDFCVASWRDARSTDSRLTFATVQGSRLFIMHDKPEELDALIRRFMTSR